MMRPVQEGINHCYFVLPSYTCNNILTQQNKNLEKSKNAKSPLCGSVKVSIKKHQHSHITVLLKI